MKSPLCLSLLKAAQMSCVAISDALPTALLFETPSHTKGILVSAKRYKELKAILPMKPITRTKSRKEYRMKSSRSAYLKTTLLIVQLALGFCVTTIAQAELPQGSLVVYSATDQFDDGGLFYYAHSSYSIYMTDGKFFKNVENHISRSDEIPSIVTLPIGSYIIEARSESRGYVRVPVVITAGRRTVLDPDRGSKAEA
jgi:hypothetical protein